MDNIKIAVQYTHTLDTKKKSKKNLNTNDLNFIRNECLFEIFENTVDSYPTKPAIIFQNREYSYKEIDSKANRLAWYLRVKGIKPGNKIGLILEKSVELYIAMLAIMKAGAAYVPIDPSHPKDRINYILENSEVSFTVTSTSIAGNIGLQDKTLLLDYENDIINKFSDDRLERSETGVTPTDLCYIIYTSGSTGRPKGVQIEHRSVCNLVRASQQIYRVNSEDRIYQGFTVAFDASIEEIWMAFGHGAALVPSTPEMQKAGSDLGRLLNDAQITILSCVPTLLSIITEDIPSLKLIIFGGEACPPHLIDKWSKPNRRLINTYGPTEATVIATYSELKCGEKVTIGKPLSNYSVYIMHEDGSFAPPGEAGELLIGGIGLTRGYIGREDLNKEKFFEIPELSCPSSMPNNSLCMSSGKTPEFLFGGVDLSEGTMDKENAIKIQDPKRLKTKRLYKTGDLARIDENGEIEFLGRIDSQVKIRGFRVELSEIESVINLAKGVKTSVVAVHDSPEGIQKLAAYIVPLGRKEAVDLTDISKLLKERLPSYMIPQYLEFIDKIPILPSGKADRKSLPFPKDSTKILGSINEVQPRNALEAKIADVWRSVFKVESVSVKHHFFNDLGGHSLFAGQTVSALRKFPEMSFLNFVDIYENPTIEQLADKVTSHKSNLTKADANAHKVLKPSYEPNVVSSEQSSGNAVSVTIAQTIWLVLELIVGSASVYLIFFSLFPWLSNIWWPSSWIDWIGLIILLPILLTIINIILMPLSVAISVAAKRILIGKYEPTRVPVWSSFYLRMWIVRQFVRLIPWGTIEGTEFQCMALRSLGARIGKRVHIHRGVDLLQGGWDLLNIGHDVTISQDASIGVVELEKGQVVLGPVTLEDGVTLDVRAVVGPNTFVGHHSWLSALSWLPEGGIIPPGEKWHGVPAQLVGTAPKPPILTSTTKCLSPIVHGMVMILCRNLIWGVLDLPYILAFVLILLQLGSYNSLLLASEHPFTHMKLFLTLGVLICLAQVCRVIIEAVIARAIGTVSSGVISRWSWAYIRVWLKTGLVALADPWLNGSRFYPVWLRVAGMKVGEKCEIGKIVDIVPELIQINSDTFFADNIYLGGPRIQQGTVTLANVVLDRHTFFGNHVVVPAGQRLPENILLGVSTMADDRVVRLGSSWFGHPPFELFQREILTVDRSLTHDPPFIRKVNRTIWEGLRFTLPLVLLLDLLFWISGITYEEAIMPLDVLLLFGVPAISLASTILLCLFVVGMKWGLLGRVNEGTHPLYSCWISRWDFHFVMWDFIARDMLSFLNGTLFLPAYLRLMGMKIGKRAVLGDKLVHVTDPDMIEIGDGATVKSLFQAHTFEDRVLKIGHIRVGAYSTLGTNTVPLYWANIGEQTFVAPCSVIMKGETLPEWTSWGGHPAKLEE